MVFDNGSTNPDITETLPLPLSRRIAADINLYTRHGSAVDIAIGGLPFFLAIDDQNAYQRATAQWKKDQFDNSKEAGEQTLSQWWVRSQASFHKGEGIGFYEPGTDELTADRYAHAVGVDPWTQGQFTLLRSMSLDTAVASGDVFVESAVIDGVAGYYTVHDSALHYVKGYSAPVTVTSSGDPAVSRPAICGSSVVVGTANGGLLKGTVGGSTIAAFTSGLPVATGVRAVPYWVKSRIIVAVGPSLYEVPLAGSGTTLAALYTHPDADWVWTSVAESPQAILASGYSATGGSAIHRFNLTQPTDGSTPELAQPVQAAEFPHGETVHAIHVYLGTYLGIGTSVGLRVGLVDTDGTITYGPILARTDSPVQCITGWDEFLVAGVTNAIDGQSGTVRVNVAEPVDQLRLAWAWDAQTHTTGTVQSVATVPVVRDGVAQVDVVLGVVGSGVWRQGAEFEPSGYLLTGKVRYGTSELKLFRQFDVDCVTNAGRLSVAGIDPAGGESSQFALTDAAAVSSGILGGSLSLPQKFVQFRLTLEPSDDLSQSPILRAWSSKALPVVQRQRLIRYPLVLADFHGEPNGVRVGRKGGAWDALQALEAVESAQAFLPVQDFRTGETYTGSIESVEVQVSSQPTRHNPEFHGVVAVTIRKVI